MDSEPATPREMIQNRGLESTLSAISFIKMNPFLSIFIGGAIGMIYGNLTKNSRISNLFNVFEMAMLCKKEIFGAIESTKINTEVIPNSINILVLLLTRTFLLFLLWITIWVFIMIFLTSQHINIYICLGMFFFVNLFCLISCHYLLFNAKEKFRI